MSRWSNTAGCARIGFDVIAKEIPATPKAVVVVLSALSSLLCRAMRNGWFIGSVVLALSVCCRAVVAADVTIEPGGPLSLQAAVDAVPAGNAAWVRIYLK